MRVLIVNGNATSLETLQGQLSNRGHDVKTASDGLDCMAILRDFAFVPDMLILDRELLWGGCDGILAVMRDDPVLRETRIIVNGSKSPADEITGDQESTPGSPAADARADQQVALRCSSYRRWPR